MNPAILELQEVKKLLILEKNEDFSDYRKRIFNTPLNQRQEDGITWYPLELLRSFIGTGERMVLEVERLKWKGEPHLFQPGKAVSLFVNSSSLNREHSSRGIVNYVRDDMMSITLNHDDIPDWMYEGKLGVNLIFDEYSYKIMERALDSVIAAEKNRLAHLRDILLGGGASLSDIFQGINSDYFLNKSQEEALKLVMRSREAAFIHGPPGTGKTTTLVEAVRQMLRIETQVLVCAPSNAAVDLLTEKISSCGISVVRIGHPARVTEASLDKTLDARISDHPMFADLRNLRKKIEEFKRLASRYKRKYGPEEVTQRKLLFREAAEMRKEADGIESYIIENIIEKSSVITCTLVGSASACLEGKRFSTVFMDEASQALEPASWVPVLKADKVVFAGDHRQLPPTIKSKIAASSGLAVTLFEKGIERNHTDIMLKVQYRMNNMIMGFSNGIFYDNNLVADSHVANWKIADNDEVLTFIDIAGAGFNEITDPDTQSISNPGEAEILLKYFSHYLKDFHPWLKNSDFGIISPYRAQVYLIRELISAGGNSVFPVERITVNTVDSFQGQERDVILISLVRSNPAGEIGFLSDTRRMNVAMTRARKKLVIIGDSATIGKNDFYNRFLDYIFKNDAYVSSFQVSSDPE
jgi:ATP-dependent RNA/DNA helicase IGHMBP2